MIARLIAIGSMAMVLSACALVEDNIDLTYVPSGAAMPVVGAEAVAVQVSVLDERPAHRDKVSVKKNGYGMEMAAIRANQDVPSLVQSAIAHELEARGFTLGEGPVFAVVEISRFYADFKTGFWSAENVGDVYLNVQVRDADGKMYYGKGITGTGKTEDVLLMEGGPVKQSLERALSDAMQRLMSDSLFTQALIDAHAAMMSARDSLAQHRGGPTS